MLASPTFSHSTFIFLSRVKRSGGNFCRKRVYPHDSEGPTEFVNGLFSKASTVDIPRCENGVTGQLCRTRKGHSLRNFYFDCASTEDVAELAVKMHWDLRDDEGQRKIVSLRSSEKGSACTSKEL